jgi:hypothetical protein
MQPPPDWAVPFFASPPSLESIVLFISFLLEGLQVAWRAKDYAAADAVQDAKMQPAHQDFGAKVGDSDTIPARQNSPATHPPIHPSVPLLDSAAFSR